MLRLNFPRRTKFFHWVLAISAALVGQGLAQTTTVTFDTAQQYYSNFTEIEDNSFTTGPGDYLDWAEPGDVRLTTASPAGPFAPLTTGEAIYNPNASTSTTGPNYATGTFACDFGTNVLLTSAQTLGLLADVQSDGQGVFASFRPMLNETEDAYATTVSITAGGTSIYTATINFVPTHATLYQKTVGGSPAFDFVLSDNAGDVSNSGFVAVTQTNVFDGGGEVGFYMSNFSFDTDNTVDNFSVSPTIVPEPEPTLWCVLFALGGIGLARVGVGRSVAVDKWQ